MNSNLGSACSVLEGFYKNLFEIIFKMENAIRSQTMEGR